MSTWSEGDPSTSKAAVGRQPIRLDMSAWSEGDPSTSSAAVVAETTTHVLVLLGAAWPGLGREPSPARGVEMDVIYRVTWQQ
jgi:hypothetical protein